MPHPNFISCFTNWFFRSAQITTCHFISNYSTLTVQELLWTNLHLQSSTFSSLMSTLSIYEDKELSLKSNTTVSTINLGSNNIGAAGVRSVVESLKSNTPLHTIDLVSNNIGEEEARSIVGAIQSNTSFQAINLERNEIGVKNLSQRHFSNIYKFFCFLFIREWSFLTLLLLGSWQCLFKFVSLKKFRVLWCSKILSIGISRSTNCTVIWCRVANWLVYKLI